MLLELNTLLPFLIASISLTLLPGPDNLFVLSTSALHGAKVGIPTALGMAAGNFFHTLVVATGLAALIAASPFGLDAIKYLGIGYLWFLAWQSWHGLKTEQKHEHSKATNGTTLRSKPAFVHFKRGLLMNLINPKVILFFLAFLPQFIDQSKESSFIQIMQLGSVFVVQAALIFCLIALLANRLQNKITRLPKRLVAGISSAVFILLSLFVLLA